MCIPYRGLRWYAGFPYGNPRMTPHTYVIPDGVYHELMLADRNLKFYRHRMVYYFKLADHCETCRYYYRHYIRCGNRYESLGKR